MTNGAAALFMRTAYQNAAIYFGDTPLVAAERDESRLARGVRVPADEVDRHVATAHEVGERRPPLVGAGGDRRPANLQGRVDLLHSPRCRLVEPEVGVLLRVLPEDVEVGLVPDLDRPAPHLLDAVSADEVRQ